MLRFQSTRRQATAGTARQVLSWLLAASLMTAPFAANAKAHAKKPAPAPARAVAAPVADKPDPEVLLVEVYKELGANRLRQALAKADKLVEDYPNFRLGHLIRGDLLLMQTQPVTTFGAVNGPEDKLKNLRQEAIVRLKWLRERPDPSLLPRLVLQLREDQKHVILVDAKRSRLYVYANDAGRLKFVSDYYVSQGKLGVNKLKAGDQKTPIGIYYITSHLSGERLPDFYGSGALPINYPNEWDKVNGRSGSGIWLHGTPPDSYSRPPLSSDGCVVLTNPDLHKLAGSVEIGKTPVVISESVDFVSKTKWESDRHLATHLVDDWRRDMESMNPQRVMENYSRQFRSDRGEDLSTWFAKHQQFMSGVKDVSIELKDSTFFFYPGRDNMIVSTFTQESRVGKGKTSIRKRQYWAKEGSQWKIVYELNL
ncbi:L,D-transpeptidase family protein [Herbaspirillum sp. ST 5-3]|uniref:L,D-transpeptidase family protein n=1 Tax=Herbaspirillum sp. ST 5-3 TaxID=2567936 RepID=UPI001FFF83EA|nr:L,D-transpeptidase family protein [Herbaspirillum sp. ST 5-3]